MKYSIAFRVYTQRDSFFVFFFFVSFVSSDIPVGRRHTIFYSIVRRSTALFHTFFFVQTSTIRSFFCSRLSVSNMQKDNERKKMNMNINWSICWHVICVVGSLHWDRRSHRQTKKTTEWLFSVKQFLYFLFHWFGEKWKKSIFIVEFFYFLSSLFCVNDGKMF